MIGTLKRHFLNNFMVSNLGKKDTKENNETRC